MDRRTIGLYQPARDLWRRLVSGLATSAFDRLVQGRFEDRAHTRLSLLHRVFGTLDSGPEKPVHHTP